MSLFDTDPPLPVETLHIQNFAGITEATIELSRMNVFIGPQASGKSVCAKLFFYFREIVRQIFKQVYEDLDDHEINKRNLIEFYEIFPVDEWGAGNFRLEYRYGNIKIGIVKAGDETLGIVLSSSDALIGLLESLREARSEPMFDPNDPESVEDEIKVLSMNFAQDLKAVGSLTLQNVNNFINAGRSFFTVFKNITFTLQVDRISVDPFLLQTGRNYERAKSDYFNQPQGFNEKYVRIQERIGKILGGEYQVHGRREYIRHHDRRVVSIEKSSSGQQEFLPLALILSMIGRDQNTAQSTTLFVEEPEAHLYPTAQREMVHLLCTALDLTSPESTSQCVLTTHSPYILTALNNLMYGAKIMREFPEREKEVRKILGETDLVHPEHVRAYHFEDGGVRPLMDTETGIILADAIDEVSGSLAAEFEALADVEFTEKPL